MTDEQRRAEARFATATGGGAARPPGQPDLEVDVADDDGADGAVAVPRDGQVNGGRSRQEREARFKLAVDASEALKLVPEVRRVRKVQLCLILYPLSRTTKEKIQLTSKS